MHDDETTVTLEISDHCVIAECDGLRAELRGADALVLKTRLAEYAIGAIRDMKAQRRYEREAMKSQADYRSADVLAGAMGSAALTLHGQQRMLADRERQQINAVRGFSNY